MIHATRKPRCIATEDKLNFALPLLGMIAVDPRNVKVSVAPESVRGMAPGEERHVPLRIEGVPELVSAVPEQEMVTVRRPSAGRSGGAPDGELRP